jgi:hypothetical protein
MKLRGIVSSGLVLKCNLFLDDCEIEWSPIGMNMDPIVGTTHYEKPISANMKGQIAGSFPTHLVPKTDEKKIQNFPDVISELENVPCYVTVKCDGCLDGSTIIETNKGKYTIKDICENRYNYKVKTLDLDTGKIKFASIDNYFINDENDDWYEIVLINGTSLKATGNHKIWCDNLKCWRRIEDLTGNEDIIFNKM